jgi:hypothetical protein
MEGIVGNYHPRGNGGGTCPSNDQFAVELRLQAEDV